jgi:hypothetical protein
MRVSRRTVVISGSTAAALGGLTWTPAAADEPADVVFYGGPIVTVNDAQPSVEAVAVKDGKIVAVGAASEIRAKWVGPNTRVVDLAGRTLLPGFIDGHGHFMNAPRIVNWANVSPMPAGPVKAIPDILTALQALVVELKIPKGQWVIGYGYDGTALAEGRGLPWFGIATRSCMQRVPRKRLLLGCQRTPDPGATAKPAAMTTSAHSAEASAFPLSVWPLAAALPIRTVSNRTAGSRWRREPAGKHRLRINGSSGGFRRSCMLNSPRGSSPTQCAQQRWPFEPQAVGTHTLGAL